jgi:hypothetical protein
MTGYESKRAAAQDKVIVTDLDGHVVRDVQKPKKVAALDRDAEIERLNEKIEFLARTNMLYSDWEHRDTQVTSELIRKGIEEHKINAELRAEIERLKQRPWVDLTDEDINTLYWNREPFKRPTLIQLANEIITKFKEKNT